MRAIGVIGGWVLGGAVAAMPALAQLPPGPLPQIPPQRNPVELREQPSAPGLSSPLQPPPLVAQTGPGAATELRIVAVTLTGNEAISEAELQPAIAGLAGATVPLARIEEARLEILRRYREAGYAFTAVDAGVTPRPGRDGADLVFRVVEGYVAEVKLEGDIGPAGTQVLRFLNRLIGLRPVSTGAIERALLLASDIPGVTVRGTLRPLPDQPGALQLVAALDRRVVSGYVNVDNRGYNLVGPWEALFVAGVNSLTEFGERTELAFFGAENSTQWFVQGSTEAFIGGSGLRARIYGGGGQTRPTGSLAAIGYYGTTQVAGAGASYPLVRRRAANLALTGSFDFFDGEVQVPKGTRASRDQVRTFRFGAEGQMLEARLLPFLPAATTAGIVRVHQGLTIFGATEDGDPFSSRSGNDTFGFTKLTGEIQRNQPLAVLADGVQVNIQGLALAQWSDDVLPNAEKCYLGGARLGRGFYAGQVTGDKCWGYAVELQLDFAYDLPVEPPLGSNRFTTQLYMFRDYGRTYENLPLDPDRRLSSWGGGVRQVISERVQFDLEGVHRVTTQPNGPRAETLRGTGLFFRTLVRF